MPLQNRVTPFSEIVAVPARGMFTGNRGILHNERKELVTTRWRHKAWIVCELEFKNPREVMQPNRWTQLFFLDEATAFAAGHRPCGYCRRAAYTRFLELSGLGSAKELDQALHPDRIAPQALVPLGSLPRYTQFAVGDSAYLWLEDRVLAWSHNGYSDAHVPDSTQVRPLTPTLMRLVLSRGYKPVLHSSVRGRGE